MNLPTPKNRQQLSDRHTEDMYTMNLNETIKIGDTLWITRVPGGWVYETLYFDDRGEAVSNAVTFVPYNNEFQETEKK